MPEIQLYEYPLSAVPVDLEQPVTLLNLHPSVSKDIQPIVQSIPDYYNPPTSWMEPLLLANDRNVLQGFKWEWNKAARQKALEPAIISGETASVDPVAALVHGWAEVWRDAIRDTQIEALPQAESLFELVTSLWTEGRLLYASTHLLSDIIVSADGSHSHLAYELVPALLLRRLLGCQTPLVGGHNAIWELVVGREGTYAVSQLLRADNGAPFAYKLEADLQTLASSRGEEPVVQLKLKQQRYPDGRITDLPENKHSVLLSTGGGQWCQISSRDYAHVLRREAAVGATALPAWDSLPDVETLRANPGHYLEQARIIYLAGMKYEQDGKPTLHSLQVGMGFKEIQSVLEPVIQCLGLERDTKVESDTELAQLLATMGRKSETRALWALERLKRSRTSDTGEILNDRIMAATDGSGLEIVVVTRRSHQQFIREFLPIALKEIFDAEPDQIDNDQVQILPNVTCRVVRLSAAEATLFEPLEHEAISEVNQDGTRSRRTQRWRPAYKQRYQALLELLRLRLPTGDGPVRFALIDKPVPPPGHAAKWQDVKGVARAAFAELDYLSQFINPYHRRKDGKEYIPPDTPHRVRQGMLDGLRQLGVVLGAPVELYDFLGLPAANIVSTVLFQTQYRDIQYPIFSRLSPDGSIALRFPLKSGKLTEWQPSYQAIPALVRLIWSTIDQLKMPGEYQQGKGQYPSLRIAPTRISEYIREALDTIQPTVLIVPAANLRNWPIWPQLGNKNLGKKRHQLMLGSSVGIERDHPAWGHLLGIVRYRGPDKEVPDYFPTSDRTGTSRDYLAPHGWFTEDEQFIRYLGVGVTQSTETNRETIHYDAHSLLHSKRQRPTSGKEIEVGAAHRYGHARLMEFVPFFVSPSLGEDGPLVLCRLAQLTRMMGWHAPTLSLSWPAHVASTALKDALDVIAAYSSV